MEGHRSLLAGNFLFEAVVTNSNALVLPYDVVGARLPHPTLYFPPEVFFLLTDPDSIAWIGFKYLAFDAENAFVMWHEVHWYQYLARHQLNPGDRIRFFTNTCPLHALHLCTQHVHENPLAYQIDLINMQLPEDILVYQKQITQLERINNRLVVGAEWVAAYFPNIDMQPGNQEMVKFTDYLSTDWYVKIVSINAGAVYFLMDGWSQIMNRHQLRAGDIVTFYSPIFQTSVKHFHLTFIRV